MPLGELENQLFSEEHLVPGIGNWRQVCMDKTAYRFYASRRLGKQSAQALGFNV